MPRNQKLEHEEVAPPVVKAFEPEPVQPEEYNPDDAEVLAAPTPLLTSIITLDSPLGTTLYLYHPPRRSSGQGSTMGR